MQNLRISTTLSLYSVSYILFCMVLIYSYTTYVFVPGILLPKVFGIFNLVHDYRIVYSECSAMNIIPRIFGDCGGESLYYKYDSNTEGCC